MMENSPRPNQARLAQQTKKASAAEQDRQQRLNKALRENLFKRKQQRRSRQQQQMTLKDRPAGQTKGMQD